MEHRCGERRPTDLTVLLRRRGWAGWVVGQLTDISITGAFIRIAPCPFPNKAVIELETTQPETARLLRSRALVVRRCGEGIGVMFDEVRPATLAPLYPSVSRTNVARQEQAASSAA
ncbi:MAG: PilZ domain-containing protein [Chromatiales bacterium]|nr:PilZ domain-containing protein [Chromatiales bacterium]